MDIESDQMKIESKKVWPEDPSGIPKTLNANRVKEYKNNYKNFFCREKKVKK